LRHGQEIKGLRGGAHRYAAQASLKIDAAMAEKGRFRRKRNGKSIAQGNVGNKRYHAAAQL